MYLSFCWGIGILASQRPKIRVFWLRPIAHRINSASPHSAKPTTNSTPPPSVYRAAHSWHTTARGVRSKLAVWCAVHDNVVDDDQWWSDTNTRVLRELKRAADIVHDWLGGCCSSGDGVPLFSKIEDLRAQLSAVNRFRIYTHVWEYFIDGLAWVSVLCVRSERTRCDLDWVYANTRVLLHPIWTIPKVISCAQKRLAK